MTPSNTGERILFLMGERLYLRPLEMSDLPRLQRWINDPETRRFLLNVRPLSEIDERKYIEGLADQPNDVKLAIVRREDDRLIGSMSLSGINWVDRCGTFGIVIGEADCRGRGHGAEATRLMLRYAFETLNLHRVQLEVLDFNRAGVRAYEKAGFLREGTARDRHFRDGRYHDAHVYALLATDYFAARRDAPS
jgi:UDP-4-amino-4,6-dideoxy-N-acetyl-beta-L-altrosamine N-acetyltransferase